VPAACRFEPLGIAPDRTAVLADPTISAFEGAPVLSRAARSTEPFNTTTEALISAVDHDAASQPAAPSSRAHRAARAEPAGPEGEILGRRRPQHQLRRIDLALSCAAPRPDKCCPTALTTPGWLSARPADAQNAQFWRTNALAETSRHACRSAVPCALAPTRH